MSELQLAFYSVRHEILACLVWHRSRWPICVWKLRTQGFGISREPEQKTPLEGSG